MLLPSVSAAKESGRRIACLNNMRQLGLSLTLYADDNDDRLPLRAPPFWMTSLHPYYRNIQILRCPTDTRAPSPVGTAPADASRSFIINGWNDYFESSLSAAEWAAYKTYGYPQGMPASAIQNPSETIAFGERMTTSSHIHMDFYQGNGNDIEELEQSRHGSGRNLRTGGSNFTFADGSTRFLRAGRSVFPINLWAVTDTYRTNSALVSATP
jgi:prepilin-type processing-associated H-X9-DG protein